MLLIRFSNIPFSIPEPTPSTMTALHQFGAEMLKLSRGLQSFSPAFELATDVGDVGEDEPVGQDEQKINNLETIKSHSNNNTERYVCRLIIHRAKRFHIMPDGKP